MKRAALLALVVAACDPIDFEFDLDLDFGGGPITGEHGAATFSLVDGCPDGNFLFGCPKTMPAFAVGARARMVIGSVSGDADHEQQLATAQFVVSDPSVLAFGRDADGFVVMQALGEGTAMIEIDDKAG
ncbi:MAG TPA: hypothetical protein VM692_14675, partial [Gammaproteobacteria bacterium]|nr:hypothetical protein [Gammaproteobacteria bacterium]